MDEHIIIHCDLDAFFAAVEVLHHGFDPEIPLVIGSDPQQGNGRGIVSTCNYAARRFGIRSAMPISEAWRRCPAAPFGPAIYIGGTRGLYGRASRKVMDILRSSSDKFEQAGIDEAYLDITQKCEGDWDNAYALARKIQLQIKEEIGLSASFGIAPTKILAKMSSEENKPNGIFRILPNEIPSFFDGRSVRQVPGIGPKTATQLSEWGLETVDEMYRLGMLGLQRLSSERFAAWIINLYEGTTSNQLHAFHQRKSLGKERTFDRDTNDIEIVLEALEKLLLRCVELLNEGQAGARVIEVKIRYQGFETYTFQKSLPVAMDDPDVFLRLAQFLFAQNVELDKPIRLIGIRFSHLEFMEFRQERLV
ncbi:MAG: DNA polymerase IV [Candidatus Poseidoniales archaeon]